MIAPVALYRHFDSDGGLLYVGIAKCPGKRLAEHYKSSPWARDIASISVEWLSDRAAAEFAEQNAIIAERPQRNVRFAGHGAATVEGTHELWQLVARMNDCAAMMSMSPQMLGRRVMNGPRYYDRLVKRAKDLDATIAKLNAFMLSDKESAQ